MIASFRDIVELARKTFSEFLEHDCLTLGAALAYYTVFALPAILVLVVSGVGLIWGDAAEVATSVQGQFQNLIGDDGGQQVRAMLEGAHQEQRGVIATVIGIAVLLISATGAVGQLQEALNRAWGVQPDPSQGGIKSFILKRVLSLGLILGIGFLLLVSLLASAFLQATGGALGEFIPKVGAVAWPKLLNFGLSLVVITVLFAAIFKFMPDAEIRWRDVWVGAAFTAVLFVMGKYVIGLYIGRAKIGAAFGGAGSLAVVFVWVYYSSLLVLLGAEFTQVWAKREGRQIRPAPNASPASPPSSV